MEEGPLTVMSSDGKELVIKHDVWSQSKMIKDMKEDVEDDNPIPLPSVTTKVLTKIIEWMEKLSTFKEKNIAERYLNSWKDGFMRRIIEEDDGLPFLFQTLAGASYMQVETLETELCKFIAKMIEDKTLQEINNDFGIKECTWEDEQALISTNEWIEGGKPGLIEEYRRKQGLLDTETPGEETPGEETPGEEAQEEGEEVQIPAPEIEGD